MEYQNSMSENIEMYLLRIMLLKEDGQPVPVPLLAQELAVSPVSANEMCRKLTDKGLITYEPYKGVTLTAQGETRARRILRHRRLWEVFIVEKLGVEPHQAESMACRFEHVTPVELAERLADFLEHPEFSPQNEPIPQGDGRPIGRAIRRLTALAIGEQEFVVSIETDRATEEFLRDQGVAPGAKVEVLGVAGDGALLMEVAGQRLTLSQPVAESVTVTSADTALENSSTRENEMSDDVITLDNLQIGDEAILVRIGGQKRTRRRLLDMGMVPGEVVKMKSVAPLGDPLELVVKGYQLSLRKQDAHQILVEAVNENDV